MLTAGERAGVSIVMGTLAHIQTEHRLDRCPQGRRDVRWQWWELARLDHRDELFLGPRGVERRAVVSD